MVKVRVTKKQTGTITAASLAKDLRLLAVMTPIQLKELAKEVQTNIRIYINKHRVRYPRPTGKPSLANAFTDTGIVFTPSGAEIGIGNVPELDEFFPYWYLIEVGGRIPPKSFGYFGQHQRPQAGGGNEWWHKSPTSKGVYMITPKIAVTGIHYIYETNEWLKRRWAGWWEKKQKQILKS